MNRITSQVLQVLTPEAAALGVGDGAVVVAIEVFESVPTDLACRPGITPKMLNLSWKMLSLLGKIGP